MLSSLLTVERLLNNCGSLFENKNRQLSDGKLCIVAGAMPCIAVAVKYYRVSNAELTNTIECVALSFFEPKLQLLLKYALLELQEHATAANCAEDKKSLIKLLPEVVAHLAEHYDGVDLESSVGAGAVTGSVVSGSGSNSDSLGLLRGIEISPFFVSCVDDDSCEILCRISAEIVSLVASGQIAITLDDIYASLEQEPDFIEDDVYVDPHDFDPDTEREAILNDYAEIDLEETEVRREIMQRRGQNIYRKRLERLWGGRCAVSGIITPELLRASHAKPWADCESGTERIDPYNGFLLAVPLDALFDKFLISFDESGQIMISPSLHLDDLQKVGITPKLKLSMLKPAHKPYLDYHRERFLREHGQKANS